MSDRVGQTVESATTDFALDIAAGLPEVIYTSESEVYLHLPGVIVTEKANEVRYLLSDGLGSIRQATDDSGAVVAYNEFDPYGNAVASGGDPYGFTGEWWQDDVSLLHLRARWYAPETGTFLSVDAVESEPAYQYVRGNVVNLVDPSGMDPPSCSDNPTQICYDPPIGPTQIQYPAPPAWLGVPTFRTDPPPPPPPDTLDALPAQCRIDDLFQARGYAEGSAVSGVVGAEVKFIMGEEVVYDFATMERANFTFEDAPLFGDTAGFSTAIIEGAYLEYDVQLKGFKSFDSLENQYSGDFFGFTLGANHLTGGVGFIGVHSPEIQGAGEYKTLAVGASPIPIVSGSASETYYNFERETYKRYVSGSGHVTKREIEQMKNDIRIGTGSPWLTNIHTHASRQKAIKELDEVWEAHKYYFQFQYKAYQQ